MNTERQILKECGFLGYDMCTLADRYQCFGRAEQLEEASSFKTMVLHYMATHLRAQILISSAFGI